MILNQLTLPAPDMAASRAFYKTLGFTVLVDSAPRYMRLLAPDGVATLSLHEAPALPAGQGWPALYFECDDLDARVRALEARGVVFDGPPVDQPWLWREAWLRDPAGVRLCLFFAGENRINPPWRVKAGA